jgi:hypothetical protein
MVPLLDKELILDNKPFYQITIESNESVYQVNKIN